MKTKLSFITLIALMTLSACTVPSRSSQEGTDSKPSTTEVDDSSTGGDTTQPDDGTIENVEIGKNVALENSDEYLAFWAPTSKVDFEFRLSDKAYQYLEKFANTSYPQYEDYYFPATVIITVNDKTYTFEEAGLRRKGNTSKGDDFANGRIHYKVSFQETFDEQFYLDNCPELYHDWTSDAAGLAEREDRTFCDMEKIDLKWNRNYDATNLRQTYTNYILREKGIITQNATIGKLNFYRNDNLNFSETYDVLECVDKVMLKRWFNKASAKGDLYKMSWSADFVAQEVYDSSYTVRPDKRWWF